MTFFNFAFCYFFLLFFGTLAVSGWYFITRGRIETLPDGTKQKKGRIFKNWFFYFTRTQRLRKSIFFEGEQLVNLLSDLQEELLQCAIVTPNRCAGVQIMNHYILFDNVATVRMSQLRKMERKHNIKFSYAGYHCFRVYKTYDQFIFPEWVRKPVAECATCFASLYGSLFYWCIVPFMDSPFAWSSVPHLHLFIFWIFYCLSLAVLNTAIAKKYA